MASFKTVKTFQSFNSYMKGEHGSIVQYARGS